MSDELTDDDRALLKVLNETDDARTFAAKLFEYYHDNDRARRTSRACMYLHLGQCCGVILKLVEPK